jgi:quercetin dioxygenase-like cupin family protein
VTLLASGAIAQVSPHNQPAEEFKFLSAKEVDALTDKPGPGAKTAYLGDHENYYVEYATRSDAGNEAEMHAHWSHYINVLSGEAVLTYGGTVTNARDTGPGQVRGSGIAGGESMTVHAGDYVQIPAGMPHMLVPAKGTKFHYVVFNTRQ